MYINATGVWSEVRQNWNESEEMFFLENQCGNLLRKFGHWTGACLHVQICQETHE